MRHRGKVVIVTGGSKGIGKATCFKFATEGALVVVNQESNSSNPELSKEVVQEITKIGGQAIAIDADVSVKSEVQSLLDKTIEKFGRLDIMVSNAGICPFEEFLKIDEKLLDKVIGINQKGAFFCSQLAMEKMIELNISGRIIFTSSVSAVFGGELQTHYCQTKGAVNQLMKSIAIAAGRYGITSNAVQPGTVITDINRKELEADPGLLKYFIKRTPMRKLATPEDVANAISFYASDEASCINGTTLTVDGGMSVNFQ